MCVFVHRRISWTFREGVPRNPCPHWPVSLDADPSHAGYGVMSCTKDLGKERPLLFSSLRVMSKGKSQRERATYPDSKEKTKGRNEGCNKIVQLHEKGPLHVPCREILTPRKTPFSGRRRLVSQEASHHQLLARVASFVLALSKTLVALSSFHYDVFSPS